MRLPPPARRCSPISVMARTLETVSRPNSRSMAARSSRSSSKTSLADVVAGELNLPLLVIPVISELHVDAEIPPAQERNHFLQRVAIFAAYAHCIALDRSLNFLFRILDCFHNFARDRKS